MTCKLCKLDTIPIKKSIIARANSHEMECINGSSKQFIIYIYIYTYTRSNSVRTVLVIDFSGLHITCNDA